MNLLVPAFLGAAALIGLPLLLHLLRLQPRRRIPFPSLHFLGPEALRDSRRHRLRRWLTLFLRALLIALIVTAFCRPFWWLEHSESSRAVVVVIDNSTSMQAEGRRAAVEAWLAPQIASLRPPDQLGVILLHPSPAWLVPLSGDLETGRQRLATLPEGYETSRYRPGLELAAAKLALNPAETKQLLLAGDAQRLAWEQIDFDRPLPPGVTLITAPPAPAPARQAAITDLFATRISTDRVRFDIVIRNFAAEPDERTITFYAGEHQLGEQPCSLPEGKPATVRAEFVVPEAEGPLMLVARLDPDELAIDDTAYAALPALHDRRVMLADAAPGAEADFLRLALTSVRGADLPAIRVDPLPGGANIWPSSRVALLWGAEPFSGAAAERLDAFLKAGGSAWIVGDGSAEQAAWLLRHDIAIRALSGAGSGKWKLRDFALDHPLFAPFSGHSLAPLLAPTFHRGWSLEGEAVEPLARWPDRSVAIAEVSMGRGRLLITGFGERREDSTLPIEASYVPLVHQAVSWLAENPLAPPLGGRVGDTVLLPGQGTWRAVQTPRPVPPIPVAGFVIPSGPGIYAFEEGDTQSLYAINLAPAESDLFPWPAPEDFARLIDPTPPDVEPAPLASGQPQLKLTASLVDEREAWWWLLVAAALVLLAELAIANRTIP